MLKLPKISVSDAVQASSLVLAAGFLLSTILNSFVFNTWGVPFTQVATPNDVLNSGLQMTGNLILGVLACLIGVAFFFTVKDHNRILIAVIRIIVSLVGMSALLRFAWHLLGDVLHKPTASTPASILGSSDLLPTLLTGIIAVSFLLASDAANFWEGKSRPRVMELAAVMGLFTGMTLVFVGIAQAGSQGFLEGKYLLTNPKVPDGCAGTVLWVGERAIAVRCQDSKPPLVVFGADNATMEATAKLASK